MLPGGGGGERGEPHGTSCEVPQGVGHEGLPALGQLHVCWMRQSMDSQQHVFY